MNDSRRQSGNLTDHRESLDEFMNRIPLPPDARDEQLKLLHKQVALLEAENKVLQECLSLMVRPLQHG